MSDSEYDDTYISFSSISNSIKKVLQSKIKVDEMFEQFTNQVNALNSSILLYNEQLKKQKTNVNDSDRGKKKFCSNINNNITDECNNNNNHVKKHRTCCYTETDPKVKLNIKSGRLN
jgi:hypothetical protein